jgi:hypothetical protein
LLAADITKDDDVERVFSEVKSKFVVNRPGFSWRPAVLSQAATVAV